MTAIKATFADFKIVRGRKVAQLVMEVPLEAANNALEALGGVPRPDAEQWVGIAPLTEEAATRAPEKPKRRFSEMSRAQQAGILCNDPSFVEFIVDVSENEKIDVAAFVRGYCNVTSRANLNDNKRAAAAWDALVTEYDAWRGKIGRP